MDKLGFIVNPIAGMGGAVGLKGTDGQDILKRAISLGAKPVAPARAEDFLSRLSILDVDVELLVGGAMMGEVEAQNTGLKYKVIGERKKETTAEDTKRLARIMVEEKVRLLVFCGGDGTARDVLDAVNMKIPVLGVPTGVKMHSAVFAVNPESAALITAKFLSSELPLREAEVMDVDEKAFREGRLSAKLYGYMLVPYEPILVQGVKVATQTTEDELRNLAAIAVYIIESMEPDVIYILGPGTTTRTIADLLEQEKTLLGVDLVLDKRIIARDVNEKQILEAIKGKKAKIIVTPIGGQGFIFGRGNQQISPRVIKKVGLENIIVIATKQKLDNLRSLRVDTGDKEMDEKLKGYIRVVTDYREERIVRVE
ncbi:TPA: ATP-NAD kinase [Candidatus Bathyarchaeota archaeon]|nr:ATP-NAD kinase [Candidatus Bathyarchaeota archaeon]